MPWNFDETVDTLDSVPEEYRGGYAPAADGKHTLLPNVKAYAAAITGNATALTKSRADLAKANKESADRRGVIKTFEDLIAASGVSITDGKALHESLKEHLDELTAKSKNGGELKVSLDRLRADYAKQIEALKTESDGKVGSMTKTLEKHLIGDVAKSALTKAEGNSTLLMPAVRAATKVVAEGDDYVVRVVDTNGDARMSTKGGFMTIDELVEELKRNTDYAMAFKSNVNGGSGTHVQTKATPRVTPGSNTSELTPAQKISRGLAKGQYEKGLDRRS